MAFHLYLQEHKAAYKERHPEITDKKEITRRLKKKWQALSDADRSDYKGKSKQRHGGDSSKSKSKPSPSKSKHSSKHKTSSSSKPPSSKPRPFALYCLQEKI